MFCYRLKDTGSLIVGGNVNIEGRVKPGNSRALKMPTPDYQKDNR